MTNSVRQLASRTHLKFESKLRPEGPNSSNHSLYLIQLFQLQSDLCYPEGNFGGNQLLDCSISLSPLYALLTNNLHVSIATSLHQAFAWLHPKHA